MSTYGKLNFLLINSINSIFISLEMQSRLIQTKLYCKFLLFLKRNVSQTFASSSCRILSLKCVCYWYSLLRLMFLFHVIIGRHYFLKLIVIQRFLQPQCCYILWNKCFERSPYFMPVISTIYYKDRNTKGPLKILHLN